MLSRRRAFRLLALFLGNDDDDLGSAGLDIDRRMLPASNQVVVPVPWFYSVGQREA